MKPVRLREAAKGDLREALRWYGERDPDLANRLFAELRVTFEFLEQFPKAGRRVPEVTDRDVRRLPVHTFPYHVVYLELRSRISVLAIAHDKRAPEYWRG
ncbi:MAG TPA: type II toxin-antitoxin system RelE/ParE family toxin [Thermoanaerobaculia bacterium]|nr:type II toxin-antitoxin system RelE/ParE family toxin [Thermoanaerobaculia bacterium]